MKQKLEKQIIGENGLSYTLGEDELYYPDIEIPEESNYVIGKYGRMRCKYLQEYNRQYYLQLLMDGELNQHLYDVDEEVNEMIERLMEERKESWGISEELKGMDQMKWIGMMGSLQSVVEEIVVREVVWR